jgi:hypothetical protein
VLLFTLFPLFGPANRRQERQESLASGGVQCRQRPPPRIHIRRLFVHCRWHVGTGGLTGDSMCREGCEVGNGSVCQSVSPRSRRPRNLALALTYLPFAVRLQLVGCAEDSGDRPSDIWVTRVWDLGDGHIRETRPARDPRRHRTLTCPGSNPAVAAK